MLSLFADMSLGSNFHVRERRFVCGVLNCHQKFVSASAVARHTARTHQTGGNSNGTAPTQFCVLCYMYYVCIISTLSRCA